MSQGGLRGKAVGTVSSSLWPSVIKTPGGRWTQQPGDAGRDGGSSARKQAELCPQAFESQPQSVLKCSLGTGNWQVLIYGNVCLENLLTAQFLRN